MMQPPHLKDNSFSITKMLTAAVLMILFLSVYSYFFPPEAKTTTAPQGQTQTTQLTQQEAPVSQIQSSNSDPISQPNTQDVLVKISADAFDLEIDTLGRIKQVYLKNHKFITPPQQSLFDKLLGKKPEAPKGELALFDSTSIRPLEVRFVDSALNQKAFSTAYTTASQHIKLGNQPIVLELTQDLGSEKFVKILTINPDLSYSIKLKSSNPQTKFVITNGARPVADADKYAFLGTIIQKEGGNLEKFEENDVEGNEQFQKAVFVAGVDRYFTSVLYTKAPSGLDVIVDGRVQSKNPIAFVSLIGGGELDGYIGAKNYQELKAIYKPLGDVVEYGWTTFFAKPLFLLLEILHDGVGNWGWAIVLLTIIVRLALFPLSYKGMMGMQKLKEIAPQMKEIQAKYKNDPQKLQQKMMELYRKNGANPLGGCLPLLLQIPVFFAIYKVLYCAVELKSVPWILWIHDLSAIDPYYVLPLLMGVTMYISQMMTPSSFTDPMQEKVFKLLPIFFTFFFIIFPFPAGLVLYWSVNNIFSIFQQILINRIFEKQKRSA